MAVIVAIAVCLTLGQVEGEIGRQDSVVAGEFCFEHDDIHDDVCSRFDVRLRLGKRMRTQIKGAYNHSREKSREQLLRWRQQYVQMQ